MRYYGIRITDEDGALQVFNPSTGRYEPTSGGGAGMFTYTSYANGQNLPGALDIEIDIMTTPFGVPSGESYVRVWGISIAEIGQASNLTGKNIEVFGGFQKGLPLATAAFNANQLGLLAQGRIFPAFGNWIGTDMTLDLIMIADVGSNAQPKNIVIDWKANTPLKGAIENTLSTAFPGYEIVINISDDLVVAHDEVGYYRSLYQFAQVVQQLSQDIIGGTYAGVAMGFDGKKILVYDQTTEKKPKQIQFIDMIGQPTWVGVNEIQITCMMRADIKMSDWIKMPPAIVTVTTAAASALVNIKAAFEGVFQVLQVRHTGQFRNPDASAWLTTINAVNPDASPLIIPPA